MKYYFITALKFYKYLAIAFAGVFFIYMLYDDYNLLKRIESWSQGLTHVGLYLMYDIVYLVIGSIYYWAIASVIVITCYLISKSKQKPTN